MKKTKRYDDGGYTGDDPIVKYRMGMIDDKGNDITKSKASESTIEDESGRGNISPAAAEFNKGTGNEPSTPKSVERTVVKTKVMPGKRITGDDTINPDVKMRSDSVKQLKESVGTPSFPKSFKEMGGNTTVKKSSANMPSMKFSLPDPLAGFDAKGKRFSGRDIEDRKKGGAIKKMAMGGSASKRADGCAVKGKTRGKMC
jgi:hypothetical protein